MVNYPRICITLFLLFSCNQAYAYLDAGTGSALIQGIIASAAALFYAFYAYYERIRSFLLRLFGHSDGKKIETNITSKNSEGASNFSPSKMDE